MHLTIKAPSSDHANSVADAIRERSCGGPGSGCFDGHFDKSRCADHTFEECHRKECIGYNGDHSSGRRRAQIDECTIPPPPPPPKFVSTAPVCVAEPSVGKGRRLEQADEEVEELRAQLAAAEALLARQAELLAAQGRQLAEKEEQLRQCA